MQVKAAFLSPFFIAGRNKALSTGSALCADSSTTASEKASSALTAGPRCGQWWLGKAWNVWTLFETSVTSVLSNPRIPTRANGETITAFSVSVQLIGLRGGQLNNLRMPLRGKLLHLRPGGWVGTLCCDSLSEPGLTGMRKRAICRHEPTGWELVFVTSYKQATACAGCLSPFFAK